MVPQQTRQKYLQVLAYSYYSFPQQVPPHLRARGTTMQWCRPSRVSCKQRIWGCYNFYEKALKPENNGTVRAYVLNSIVRTTGLPDLPGYY